MPCGEEPLVTYESLYFFLCLSEQAGFFVCLFVFLFVCLFVFCFVLFCFVLFFFFFFFLGGGGEGGGKGVQ